MDGMRSNDFSLYSSIGRVLVLYSRGEGSNPSTGSALVLDNGCPYSLHINRRNLGLLLVEEKSVEALMRN